MAKALNQLLYSETLFGGDAPQGGLRLEATSSSQKGPVELVGSAFDLITASQIGRFRHQNTGTQYYELPDYSGTVLVSGLFTEKNQLIYSVAAGVASIMSVTNGGALVSDKNTGNMSWTTGTLGQVLGIDAGGQVRFKSINTGQVMPSTAANTLAYYAEIGDIVSPLTTAASRALLSTADKNLIWSLITAPFLATTNGDPLSNGTSGEVLTSLGNGYFIWAPRSSIDAGIQYRIPYYSAEGSGSVLTPSSYFGVDETNKALVLLNQSGIRFYEAVSHGNLFVELRAPETLSASKTYILPYQDGNAGNVLVTDGSGGLSFTEVGQVSTGQSGQIGWYASSGSSISGLSTIPYRALLSNSTSALWSLITSKYLKASDDGPLVGGGANQILGSDGNGGFLWSVLASPDVLPTTDGNSLLVDKTTGKLSYATLVEMGGTVGDVAFYSGGQQVTHASGLVWTAAQKTLEIKSGGKLAISASNNRRLELQASSAMAVDVTLTLPAELPAEDGLVLTGNADGTMSFTTPGSSLWEKRGVISLQTGSRATTVIYDSPYPVGTVPAFVSVQWKIPEDIIAYLPTYAVEASTEEGFVIKYSTAIPLSATPYRIFWESYRTGASYNALTAYLLGGETSFFLNSVSALMCDTDTIAVASATLSARGYCAAGASSTEGYVFGGRTSLSDISVISKISFATVTLTTPSTLLNHVRSGAAGVGTREVVYVAGGEFAGTGRSSIEKCETATDTLSDSPVSLPTNDVLRRASATTATRGLIVRNDALSSGYLLDYATGGVTASGNFGVPNISAGCNLTRASTGYLGCDNGSLFGYDFTTDISYALTSSLTSNTGLSGAVNSLSKGYFFGADRLEAVDFTTETVTNLGALPVTGFQSASLSGNFQSKGLL